MKIAVYYDVPFGGAHVAMDEIISGLNKGNVIILIPHHQSPFINLWPRRWWADMESLVFQPFIQYRLARAISQADFQVVLVSHDRHFQAPWLLRFLKIPTVFLCQEPTRALFEKFLSVDPRLPFYKRFYEKAIRSLRKRIEIKNAHSATRIISNSVFSARSILAAYGRPSTPVHMGFNSRNFFPMKLPKLPQVMVVGNHEPQKALPFAIEVISHIATANRPQLIIVSPRHRRHEELFRLAKDGGVSLSIKENITTAELRRLYNQSKALLAVARLEPFGLSVIESLACGTPVVAVKEGGYRETVINGQNGFLVKRDALSLAQKLEMIIQNDSLGSRLGLQGIKDVKTRFMWPATVNKILKVLHEVA